MSKQKKIGEPRDWILWESEDFLVINKPPFISTLEDRNDRTNILAEFKELYPEVHVCHRLDKETSGALLLSKNEAAYRHASLQFENREIEKVYHALVKGRFMDDVIKVDVPLKITGSGKVRIDARQGKESETLFRAKANIGAYTLIEAKPISGRRHQIRVHLAYLNFPICGDVHYGGEPIYLSHFKKKYIPPKDREERPLFDRVALHAYSLKFKDMKGENVEISSPYPGDLEMILEKLKKFG